MKTLRDWVEQSRNIVFFGGAGVSTESGIPDFRGVDGLYRQQYDYPPETILSHAFFLDHPEVFFRFYREKILMTGAQPNPAHIYLARLEAEGKLSAVITQNIDGLHQKAGSKRVYELHGSIHRNYCMKCGRAFTAEQIVGMPNVPRCGCGGRIKPDVVLYGERLDDACMRRSLEAIAAADMLIIGGTSLSVYPAAGLIDAYRGNRLVLINQSVTARDAQADLVLRTPIGQVFAAL